MTMNDNELLSALIDGELGSADIDRALALLEQDKQAKEQLQRFQRSSDLTRGYKLAHQDIDISTAVSEALHVEPAYEAAPAQEKDNVVSVKTETNTGFLPDWFWQQAMGLAIAASIGALAVVGVWQQSEPTINSIPLAVADGDNQSSEIVSVAQAVAKQQAKPVVTANRWTVGEPEVADRLNTYLVDHNEYAGTSAIFSNARVIAYEVE